MYTPPDVAPDSPEQLENKRAWVRRLSSMADEEKANTSRAALAAASDGGDADDSYRPMQDPMESRPDLMARRASSKTLLKKQSSSALLLGGEPVDLTATSDDEEEIYIVRQSYGYCSFLFSLAQTVILIVMMAECGVAPMTINPMFGPYPDALSEWGGKNAVNILDDNEWWRLLTPILLHAGVIHLLCNVAVQVETSAFFEREWGSLNWCIIYLTSAVGSSILSVICMPDSISVGSSGAVMGLFGGKLAEVMCRACESNKTKQQRVGHAVRQEQLSSTLCAVTLVMAFSFIPYVDWSAHLGGLVAGFLVGIPVFACSIKTVCWRVLWFLVGTAITVWSFTQALVYMYSGAINPADELRDVCGYYQQFFDDYECRCMRPQHEGNNN